MVTGPLIARDVVIRQAAFDHIRRMQRRDVIPTHDDIARGLMSEGERWPLWNRSVASSSRAGCLSF